MSDSLINGVEDLIFQSNIQKCRLLLVLNCYLCLVSESGVQVQFKSEDARSSSVHFQGQKWHIREMWMLWQFEDRNIEVRELN